MTLPATLSGLPPPAQIAFSDEDFAALAALARREIGLNLTENKKHLIYSRLSPRLKARNLSSFAEYLALLSRQDETEEHRALISALTTNVTSFFRENHHFDILRKECLPGAIARAEAGGRLRIWSAGCSSGQEPYCIAMTLLDAMPEAARHDVRILATDIDPKMVAKAEAGLYPEQDVAGIPPLFGKRFFDDAGAGPGQRSVARPVRDLIAFAELNLMADWPFRGPFDAIFCRNVAIYFDMPTQQRLWDRFCAFLAPGGFLFIGHSERITGPAAQKTRPAGITCFRRLPAPTAT